MVFSTSSGKQTFVNELSSYACSLSDHLIEEKELGVFISFAHFILPIFEIASHLVILRDSTNAPRTSKTPFVLPSQLRQISSQSFHKMLNKQSERL